MAEQARVTADIKQAQQRGFSLAEIRELLELRSAEAACCDDIYRVALEKKLRLEIKVRALHAMAQSLGALEAGRAPL